MTPIETAIAITAGIVIPLLGILISHRLTTNVKIEKEREKFPFYKYSLANLNDPEFQQRLGGSPDLRIPYLKRLPPEEHSRLLEDWLDVLNDPKNPHLILTGVSGIGKTREVINLLQHLNNHTRYGPLTVLIPQPNMDEPVHVPSDVNIRNLVLLISDLDVEILNFGGEEQSIQPSIRIKDYQNRLLRVIKHFESFTQAYELFRVIVTVRSQPNFHERIQLNNSFWRDHFTIKEVPEIAPIQLPYILENLSRRFAIPIVEEAEPLFQEVHDGTFVSLSYFFEQEKYRETEIITYDIVKTRFVGVCREAWERDFAQQIEPYPSRVAVVNALKILYGVRVAKIKVHVDLAVEIAARLLPSWKPLRWRRRRASQALNELMAWFKVRDHLVFGHFSSYFDTEYVLTEVDASILLQASIFLMKSSTSLAKQLFNSMYNYSIFLETNGMSSLRVRLLSQLAKTFNMSAYIHDAYSDALFWVGHMTQALEEVEKAIAIDPTVPFFHAEKGAVLYSLGELRHAELSLAAALKMSDSTSADVDFFLYQYGLVLEGMGIPEKARLCYEQVLQINPSYVAARCALATLLLKKDETKEEAYKEAAIAFGTEPQRKSTIVNLARLYRRCGKPDETLKMLQNLSGEFHNETAILVQITDLELAICHLQLGNVKQAQEYAHQSILQAKKLLNRKRSNTWVLHNFILANLIANRFRVALKNAETLFDSCPYPGSLDELSFDIEELVGMSAINKNSTGAYFELIERIKRAKRYDPQQEINHLSVDQFPVLH